MSKADSLNEFLKKTKAKIDAHILDFLPQEHSQPEVQAFYEMMLDYPLRGGKGLRSAICLLICEAFGGNSQKAFNTAAALELMQNWALVHDDIEDASDLRRGQPCLHRKYGIPLAINAGDGLYAKMWEMLLRNADQLGHHIAFQIALEFSQLSNELIEGQHMELSWVANNRWDLTEADYWAMCVRKTASYTIITPCRLGAMIAGASKETLDHLTEIGTNLGVAFQIQDDVLNLRGSVGKYGKEIAGDINEGKRTLILIHLLSCMQAEKQRLIEIMSKPRGDKRPEEISYVLSLMEKYKSIEYAKSRSLTLAQQGFNQFNRVFADLPASRAKDLFLDVMHFVIGRVY